MSTLFTENTILPWPKLFINSCYIQQIAAIMGKGSKLEKIEVFPYSLFKMSISLNVITKSGELILKKNK